MDNGCNITEGWELSPHLCTTVVESYTNFGNEEGEEEDTYGTSLDWKIYTQPANVVETEGTCTRIKSRKVCFKYRKNGSENTLYTARTTVTDRIGEPAEVERSGIVKVKNYGRVRTQIAVNFEESSGRTWMEDGVSDCDLTSEIVSVVDMDDRCGEGSTRVQDPVRTRDCTRRV